MDSPALAIGWAFRRRHRWGLIGVTGYLVVIGVLKLLITRPGRPMNLDSPGTFALVVVVPLAATFTYCLAVFSFGLDGDLAARESMFPARMLALPVTNGALAGWPMLYGTAAMAVLWLATRLLAVWPPDVHIPVIWPALLAASLLAWTQALMWTPFGLRGVRPVAAVLWLALIDTVVITALHFDAPEPVMLAILAPHVPLAYLAARRAVARARRGEVPDWRARVALERSGGTSRLAPFPSAARAQTWFEWRRHGRTLPALVAILLPFELAVLAAAADTPPLVLVILLAILGTPPFMAWFVAAAVSKSGPDGTDSHGLTPFTATRPLTSVELTAAHLKAAAWSTLAAWVVVLVLLPAGIALSGTAPMVIDRVRRVTAVVGAPRSIAVALVAIAALLGSTWTQLVNGFYLGLGGRAWVVKGSVFLALAFLVGLGPVVQWIADHRAAQVRLWGAIPAILAGLVVGKMAAAVWVAVRLGRTRLVSDRTLLIGAAGWAAAVLVLYAVLSWLLLTPLFPRYLFGLVAILAVPLARVSAAPLALAWNRHR